MEYNRTTSQNTSRSISHSKLNRTTIDSITLKEYVKIVKHAPSINEGKVALIKKQIKENTYMTSGLLEKMADKMVSKF
ncbi:MAG: flagellar biosynthesis anti-sigma factor FlgM [Candidatus Wallbacteria bacterium]